MRHETKNVKCLQHRAERICDKEHLNKEQKHLEEVFEKNNGFPKKIVQMTIMHKRDNKRDSGSIDEKTN